jgi:acyl-CoA thioesterase
LQPVSSGRTTPYIPFGVTGRFEYRLIQGCRWPPPVYPVQDCTWNSLQKVVVRNMVGVTSWTLAQACADFLWRQDAVLQSLGLERLSIEAGQATVAMTVLPVMVNGLGITHGGVIFQLADAAFSLASNTYNERTVSAHCSISFLRPTRLGNRLVATATEVVRSGRSGIYDVSMTFEDKVVAEFRAHSRVIGGALLPAETDGSIWVARVDQDGDDASVGGSIENGDWSRAPESSFRSDT